MEVAGVASTGVEEGDEATVLLPPTLQELRDKLLSEIVGDDSPGCAVDCVIW